MTLEGEGVLRLGIDIGGTFTDVVLEGDGGRLTTTKVLTTTRDPQDGVLTAVDKVMGLASARPADVGLLIHGTTLVTNALIERRGAITALLTTEGHRDALEIGTESRFAQYDIFMSKPEPLVPRDLRLPVPERMSNRGEVLTSLDPVAVDALAPELRRRGVQAVAIGFLHSYANSAHERLAAERLRAALPDLAITLSSEVSPELREYERFSTACANAYVQPLVASYLASLQRSLRARGYRCPLFLMLSGGGLCALETAIRAPIRLIESGPAGGAMFASDLARRAGLDQVMSFDMGGTTAKICLIDRGRPQTTRSFEAARAHRFLKGSGLPLRIPTVDMVEIGAGGGSIAKLDQLGRIAVGPESAGSEPGPACYGRGGAQPTVTDADLALGRIEPSRFAGGDLPLDRVGAEAALHTKIAEPLGLDVSAAAFGVCEIVDENMAGAARVHAIESGKAYERRAMIAFGGAAPLHAARVAEKLQIQRVIVPSYAGVGSAVGFLRAPAAFEVIRSSYQLLSAPDIEALNLMLGAMSAEAREAVRQAAPGAAVTEIRSAFLRYVGQAHELEAPVPPGQLGPDAGRAIREAFEEVYRGQFNRLVPGVEIEAMSWKVEVKAEAHPAPPWHMPEPGPEPPPRERRRVFDAMAGAFVDTAIHDRRELTSGAVVRGPAVIEEDETSTVLTSGFDALIAEWGVVLMRRNGSGP